MEAMMPEKAQRNLLSSAVGRDAYKKIVRKWTTARIREIMRMETPHRDLKVRRNNILYAELQRRRRAS